MTQTFVEDSASRPALPPLARGHFIVGLLPELQRDLFAFYRDAAKQYGDVVRLRVLGIDFFAVSHPEFIHHILQENAQNYLRGTLLNNIAKLILNDSVFTTDGASWSTRRRLLEPSFHRDRIESFGNLMTAYTVAMLDEWKRDEQHVRDIEQEMTRLTLRIIGQLLFGADLERTVNDLGVAFTQASEYVDYRLRNLFAPPLFVPTRDNRKLKHALRVMDDSIYEMIRARRRALQENPNGDAGNDLLSMLMQTRDADTGAAMSDYELRNELATLMFAGHETTAAALSWAFYLLSQNPRVEEKLYAEVRDVLQGRVPTIQDLPNLMYTRNVIDETLRLYPPAWGLSRQSIVADEIGGYTIPANANVSIIIYNLHHDARWWDNPEEFDPDRFRPERAANHLASAYIPFASQPRLCLGNVLALTEAQLVLATIVSRYQLRLMPGHPVEPKPLVVLRSRAGLPMTLLPRTAR